MAIQMGTWVNPWRKIFVKNNSHPLLITNIAGGSEEFVIGSSSRCSELTMSCGPLRGARGRVKLLLYTNLIVQCNDILLSYAFRVLYQLNHKIKFGQFCRVIDMRL